MDYLTPQHEEALRRRYKVCNLVRDGAVTDCLMYPRQEVIRGTMGVTVRTRSHRSTSPLRVKEVCEVLLMLAGRVPDHALSMRIEYARRWFGKPLYDIRAL